MLWLISGGRWKRILFVTEDGKRKTIRLGKTSIKQAEAFKIKLEALIAGRFSGSIDPETARWIGDLPDNVHAKLAKVGLAEARILQPGQQEITIRQWSEQYIRGRSDLKAVTKVKLEDVVNKLSTFFGEQSIETVTVQQAKDYRVHLKSDLGLAENTVRRQIGRARQFFGLPSMLMLLPKIRSGVKGSR